MSDIIKYGKSGVESSMEDMIASREIVQEILAYGVTQEQILQIAYLLTLELESRTALVEISTCIKKYKEQHSVADSGIITDV